MVHISILISRFAPPHCTNAHTTNALMQITCLVITEYEVLMCFVHHKSINNIEIIERLTLKKKHFRMEKILTHASLFQLTCDISAQIRYQQTSK